MDRLDPAGRSQLMSRIKSKGNRSTELRMRMLLVRAGIAGWRMHAKGIAGNPDFVFPGERIAVFVDGCFWHGCPLCGHIPESNQKYWQKKILGNMERDERLRSKLTQDGWTILQVWEHELDDTSAVLSEVQSVLEQAGTRRPHRPISLV